MDSRDKEKIEKIIEDRKTAHQFLVSQGSQVYRAFLDVENKAFSTGVLEKKHKELLLWAFRLWSIASRASNGIPDKRSKQEPRKRKFWRPSRSESKWEAARRLSPADSLSKPWNTIIKNRDRPHFSSIKNGVCPYFFPIFYAMPSRSCERLMWSLSISTSASKNSFTGASVADCAADV